jgi:hypothetical protein
MRNGNKRVSRKRTSPTLACFKSSITTGTRLLHDVDGRSAWMRRLRDLIADHVSDLGGPDVLSTAEKALIRRAAMLTVQTELMESRWNENNGEASPRQIETYQRTANTLRRLLESLGLRRRARDVTPTDYRALIRRVKEAHPA